MNKRIGNRRYIILWDNGLNLSKFGEKMINVGKINDEKEIDRFIEKLKKIKNKK